MKHKATDMKEILTTGEDRVAKVNEIKEFFHNRDIKVRVSRRKLASGEKFYFHFEASGSQYDNNPEVMWGRPFRDLCINTVKNWFPNASVSSG
jgi:hypothetical protein